MNINISKAHSNRSAKNWLIYELLDNFLIKNKNLLKGNLYDLGCGESPYKPFFLECADNYIGVDWGESVYSSKPDIIADLNKKLPIESKVADSIISISVMEHLHEPQMMLNEAYRLLKEGGSIVMQVPWQWQIHEAPFDFFRYSPYGLQHMFTRAGFTDIVIEPSSGFFTTWLIKFNYLSSRLIRGSKVSKIIISLILSPFWYINQKMAPILDKLDNNWSLESQGYFITARKIPRL